jgi:hypothetical protein
MRWRAAPATIFSRPNHSDRRADRPSIRSRDDRDANCTLPGSLVHTHAGRLVPALRSRPSPAPKSNSHSARCTAGAKLPATSCLGAFGCRAARAINSPSNELKGSDPSELHLSCCPLSLRRMANSQTDQCNALELEGNTQPRRGQPVFGMSRRGRRLVTPPNRPVCFQSIAVGSRWASRPTWRFHDAPPLPMRSRPGKSTAMPPPIERNQVGLHHQGLASPSTR